MLNLIKRLVKEEEGQGMVEYGLIIALVSIAVITALGVMSGGLNGIFGEISEALGVED